MFAWGDFSISDTLFGAGRSDACAVGRSGESLEAPCWQTISLVAAPFASIDTIAAWSNGRRRRWTYSRDASRSARVSPRALTGISTYPSYSNSRITREGIGAGELDIGVGGGGSLCWCESWRSSNGCRRWRSYGHRLRHGDIDIPRRLCWCIPDRGDPRCFRLVPGDVTRISDPLCLRIQEPVAIPPVIIPKT